jgi:hypothetical protein
MGSFRAGGLSTLALRYGSITLLTAEELREDFSGGWVDQHLMSETFSLGEEDVLLS